MIPLTADDTRLLKDLEQFVEPVGVFDPNGKLLGLYVPVSQQSHGKSQFDPEEIKRRLATEKPVGNFSELVQRLKLLEIERQRRRAAGEKDFTTLEDVQAFLAMRNSPQPSGAPG